MAAFDEVVMLNVGGVVHTTTLSTLRRFPHSMLGAMFSGSFTPSFLKDSQGRLFIDRDGDVFRIILNFMRSSRLCPPQTFKDFELLEAEADFYQIPELIMAIKDLQERQQLSGDDKKGPSYYLEVLEFEETAYFYRFYMPPPNRNVNNGGAFKSGGIIISGHKAALKTLPISKNTEGLDDSTDMYHSVQVANAEKMPLFHFMTQQGWSLLNTSFSYSTDSDGSYIVHKYVWFWPGSSTLSTTTNSAMVTSYGELTLGSTPTLLPPTTKPAGLPPHA